MRTHTRAWKCVCVCAFGRGEEEEKHTTDYQSLHPHPRVEPEAPLQPFILAQSGLS